MLTSVSLAMYRELFKAGHITGFMTEHWVYDIQEKMYVLNAMCKANNVYSY